MKGLWNLYTTTRPPGVGLVVWNFIVLIIISLFTAGIFVGWRKEWPKTLLVGFVTLTMYVKNDWEAFNIHIYN